MLPKHGVVYAVFLLARAARLRPRDDVAGWIDAARASGSYMATATDLAAPARFLVEVGLVGRGAEAISPAPSLLALSQTGDRETLKGIARLVLTLTPPQWLQIAITADGVARDYIPQDDLNALLWLEPDLDELLLGAYSTTTAVEQSALRKKMGDAAELMILAALALANRRPIHVARLSDSYGYDIEARDPMKRIEVKAAGETTRDRFHLSRNEFDKCRTYGKQWTLLQLTFKSEAHIAGVLDCSHVREIRRLDSHAVAKSVPADTETFRWAESAIICPPEAAWSPARVVLDPGFSTAGFAGPLV
jgi:hypothetical protein